jgi:type VI secretion system protein ImpL
VLIARLVARRSPAPSSEMTEQAVERPERPPLDTAPLLELTREADRRLSKQGKGSLSDLPLYLLAGAPGAGKTTTFLAADLSSELIAGQAHRETTVLPTSFCNFWFASESVFVEAGGRFFTEDVRDWRILAEELCGNHSVLGKLSSGTHRNGGIKCVVWFCDVATFLGVPDPARISNLARKVKERLLVLAQAMGSSFPVYVVFTKADNLPHFADFFHHLPESDERQILGVTLEASNLPGGTEIYADAQTKRLLEPFNALYLQLAAKRLRLLSRETAKNRSAGIYEFPREVKRVRDSLLQFLVEAFRPNPLQPSPLLRGFYFTGVRELPAAAISAAIGTAESAVTPKTIDATVMFQAEHGQA